MRKYYEEKEKGGAMKYIVPFLCVIVLIAVFAGIFYLRGKQDKKKAEDTIKKIISAEPMSKQYFSLEPLEITAS